MGYYVDLKNISLDEYKAILKSADLIPSRVVLKENIDDIFDAINAQKIENVAELRTALKNKKKLIKYDGETQQTKFSFHTPQFSLTHFNRDFITLP